jgi:hypothetical protein
MILIKFVLSTFSLYQCSVIIAPKCIARKISMKIKSFLRQGGKSNHKKFHLVNWNQVTNNKNHGGLGIREPKLMNIAMRSKFLWRLLTGNMDWWKQALWKKYFTVSRTRCLDYPLKVNFGSPIFKLLLASRPKIKENLN